MNRCSNSLRHLTTIAIISSLVACSESSSSKAGADFGDQKPVTPTPPTTTFNQQALLANIVDNIITPTYQTFLTQSQAQQASITEFCDIEKSYSAGDNRQPVTDALAQSKAQWVTTMNQWQMAEVMQIGPLTVNSSTLRNNIYSWPTISSCGVDQDVMFFKNGSINTAPYDITQRTSTRRGLDAIEYLIYNESLDHSCASEKAVLATWPALSNEEKRVARCSFAVEVANDITNSAEQLNAQWAVYAQTLKNAGQSGSQFSDAHEGVNAVSDALFYLDNIVKDVKIGTPLGLFNNDCGGVGSVCVDNVESALSQQSVGHLINNLEAFKKIFTGQGSDNTNSIGFDDYLIDVDDKATSDGILTNIEKSIDDLKAYQLTLSAQLASDTAVVEATHSNVKAVTDQMKADFINSLALKLPATSAGDND